MADPYFMCQLALELGVTLDDLGRRESNYNVCVTWPAFFEEREYQQRVEQAKQDQQRGAR